MNESRPPDDSDERRPETDGDDRGPDTDGPEQEPRHPDDGGPTPDADTPAGTADSADGGAERAAADDGPTDPDAGEAGGRGGGPYIAVIVAAIALVIALAAGAVAGVMFERLTRLEDRLAELPDERASAIESAVERVDTRDRLAAAERGLRAAEEAREALRGRLEERIGEFAAALDEVREATLGHHTRWRLAEVRYLVSAAHQRLELADDTAGAVAALEAADEALHRLGDSRVLALRRAVVEDIAAIRAAATPDIEGIALRLHNLERRVDQLPRARGEAGERVAAAEVDPEAPLWRRLVDRLQGLVVVRERGTAPVSPAPEDAERLPAREALGFALAQARRAALAADASAYEAALARARELVDARFDADSAAVGRFSDALGDLLERSVSVDLPDLGPTLDLTAEITDRLEAESLRRPQAGTTAGGEE